MQASQSGQQRKWLNPYMVISSIALGLILIGVALSAVASIATYYRSFTPIDTVQATKVETASSYLETIGFADPVYLGVQSGTEGDYPTFQVTALGGERIDLWIRTSPDGGMSIQPVGYFGDGIASAYELARAADWAVSNWENAVAQGLEPRTDGAWGEYEGRQYDYELLLPYAGYTPDWSISAGWDESSGWPQR